MFTYWAESILNMPSFFNCNVFEIVAYSYTKTLKIKEIYLYKCFIYAHTLVRMYALHSNFFNCQICIRVQRFNFKDF